MPVTYTVKITIKGKTSPILITDNEQEANLLAKSLSGNEFIEEVKTETYASTMTTAVEGKPKQ